jgi:hypothetical protein
LHGGILTAISAFAIYAAVKDYDKVGFIPSFGGIMITITITICGYAVYRRIVNGRWDRNPGGD